MRKKMKNPGRKALAAGAVGLAAAAMVFGATTAASAATGHSNEGIRNPSFVPTSPATSFAAPGTTGTLTYNAGDGTATGTFSLSAGDVRTTHINLPQGMAFASTACDGKNYTTATRIGYCALSVGNRVIVVQTTALGAEGPFTIDASQANVSLPVVSTGLIRGQASFAFEPWTGLTTATPTATLPASAIPGSGADFAATGATGPVDGNYTLTGTSQPGATITIKDADGDTVGTTTADASGNWSAQIPVAGTTPPLSITQTVGSDTSAPIIFNTAPLPVMNGVVAAGAIALAGLGFGGARLLRRSRVTA